MPNIQSESILNTHDFLNLQNNNLRSFFLPRNVALVGASEREGSVGRATFENLLAGGFKGKIFPVNSAHPEILSHKAFASLKEIPDPVDLIVITVPAKAVSLVIQQAIEKSIPSAIVISAGFKETGPEGKKLEEELLRLAKGKLRILGPNCLGLMAPHCGLNATFAQTIAKPGNVAFISQSGALCTAILDWSLQESFGFSGFISTGSMADVGWGDLIDYFGADEATKSIVIYMESIGDARSFMSAAREVSLNKPIIVIKAGRTQAAAKAAASHTGSLTGSDEVLDAAFHRCGVLRVDEISEVFYMADVLGKQPLPKGPKLAIVTNAGGPGVLATDALVGGGGKLAALDADILQKLNAFLPAAWSHGNPIDILGDAEPERYSKTLKEVVGSKDNDGVLVITTPQGMTNPLKIAQELFPFAKSSGKPILASWMGGEQVAKASDELNRIGIPSFPFPDAAAKAFNYMWQSQQNLKMLYETPEPSNPKDKLVTSEVHSLLLKIKETGRTILSEFESKTVLEKYDIPTVPTKLARSADEAAQIAVKLGFPVVLKIHSETITHKSDIGGVFLNLKDQSQVKAAFQSIKSNVENKATSKDFLGVTVQPMISLEGYELILGSSVDPQFGPTLLFGSGGQLVEVFQDRSLALPPLTTTLARQMMQNTKIFKALLGVRARKPVDLRKLEDVLVRFSELVMNHPEIAELDINPLLVSDEKIIALDARILLHPKDLKTYPIPAIRPYPMQYSGNFKLKNGQELFIRPIRPEDESKMRAFHGRLSEQTIYSRFLRPFNLSERTQHERLTRICFIDYDREIALVALKKSANDEQILAIARMKRTVHQQIGNISLIVEDDMQGKGLGKELVARLIQIAKDENLDSISAFMDSSNEAMSSIFKQLGFSITPEAGGFRVQLPFFK